MAMSLEWKWIQLLVGNAVCTLGRGGGGGGAIISLVLLQLLHTCQAELECSFAHLMRTVHTVWCG